MPILRRTTRLVIMLGALSLLLPARAEAYIDPGTGSYFLQMAFAGILAASYVLKLYWRKVFSIIRRPFIKGSENEADGR